MKVGFGGKGKKKKKGGGKKGGKQKGGKGGDADMADAAGAQPAQAEQRRAGGSGGGGGGAPQATAKEKQRNRMELKRALKVRVAGLKAHRAKLTKLAGNKEARRSLNVEMRAALAEQLGAGSKGRAAGPAGGAADGAAEMATAD